MQAGASRHAGGADMPSVKREVRGGFPAERAAGTERSVEHAGGEVTVTAIADDRHHDAAGMGRRDAQGTGHRAAGADAAEDAFTLRQLAPCGFYHSDYYRNFYRKPGWHDEAGVLLQLTPERGLGVFFGSARRTVAVRYPQRADLRSALTLVKSVARLHGEVVAAPAEADTGNDDGAQARYLLTPREREIVDLILAGCGSQQIADRLFISLGTVKNHRKNIYGKLNIGSQAELFSLLLTALQRRSA